MTTTLSPTDRAAAVLAHHDDLLDVFASITQDCVLAGLIPVHVTIAAWTPGYHGVSVQLGDVDSVDLIAAAWRCHPDDGKTGNYTRQGVIDIDGRTVTVTAYCGRPRPPAFPVGYAPVAVQS